jgi:hypothetical protein
MNMFLNYQCDLLLKYGGEPSSLDGEKGAQAHGVSGPAAVFHSQNVAIQAAKKP